LLHAAHQNRPFQLERAGSSEARARGGSAQEGSARGLDDDDDDNDDDAFRSHRDVTLKRHVELLHLQMIRPVGDAERELLARAAAGRRSTHELTQQRARAAPPRAPSGSHWPPPPQRPLLSASATSSRSLASSPAPSCASGWSEPRSARSNGAADALDHGYAQDHASRIVRRHAARAALSGASSPRSGGDDDAARRERAGVDADGGALERNLELFRLQLVRPVTDAERVRMLTPPASVAGTPRPAKA
jgi:hypothetical protein